MTKHLLVFLIIIITVLPSCSGISPDVTTPTNSDFQTSIPTQSISTTNNTPAVTRSLFDLKWLGVPAITPLAPIVGDNLNIERSWKNDSSENINTAFDIKLQVIHDEITVYEESFKVALPVQQLQESNFSARLENIFTEPGQYQILLTLDGESLVSEITETNNISSSTVYIPDLSQTPAYSKEPDAAAIEQAKADIEVYRKGDVSLTVVDSGGEYYPDVTVEYRQVEHSFLFGVFEVQNNTKMWTQLDEAGINFMLTWADWRYIEPEPGVYNFDPDFYNIPVIEKYGFPAMANCAMWLALLPDYLKNLSFEEFKNVADVHFTETVNAFKDAITIWNVFNEPMQSHANELGLTKEQTIEIIKQDIRIVRENDPEAKTLINNFSILNGADPTSVYPYDFLVDVISEGVDFDIIGLEFYYNSVLNQGLRENIYLSLAEIGAMVDRYATLGKPINITELTVPSEPAGRGYWGQPWSEELQAEYLKEAYTIFFSKPSVDSITWFNATDMGTPFVYHGGILDEQNNPKKSYYMLKKLIRDWTTTGSGKTDNKGQFDFRGFGGTYEITVTDTVSGTTVTQLVIIEEQTDNNITIVFK